MAQRYRIYFIYQSICYLIALKNVINFLPHYVFLYTMELKAIILGASGLVGGSLLQQLLADRHYTAVQILVRHPLPLQHPKLKQLVVDFDQLSRYTHEIQGDVVFCCLGTTSKKTPDREQYRKVDYQYPLDVAWIAHTNGATQYHLISSMGADIHSSIFYSKLKGEVERDLKAIPFKTIHIYRPSLLVGDRKESRFGEGLMSGFMRIINPLLVGSLSKYRSIEASTVARAMLLQSLTEKKEIYTHFSDEIQELGRK